MDDAPESPAAETAPPDVDAPNEGADGAPAPRELSPLLQAVLTPISEANPVGGDVKYEDSFQQLKTEVDKVQSAGADADFDVIVSLGKQVLGTQSKDLTAAAYLGFGLIHTQGFEGVAEGADTVRILCETYWDDMYPPPKRMVARKNALQLLIDRAHDWLETQKPTTKDGEPLQRALDSYKVLQGLVTEPMGEHVPVMSKMTRILEEKLRTVPKPAAPKPEASTPAVGASASAGTASAASAGGASGTVASSPDDFRSRNEAERSILAAATYLKEESQTVPASYRVVRALRWGSLVAPPPDTDGKTMIPGFAEQRKAYLDGLLSAGQFADLVDEAEVSFREHPFWLDLQRYLVTACDALGAPFAAVREEVMNEVMGLIRRFPDLPMLRFEDNAPFADAATQEWVDLRVRTAMSSGGDAVAASTSDSAVDADFADARQHLAKGDLDAALAALSLTTDSAGRDRFRRRLYLATLCARGGRPAVARGLLEKLDHEITAHGLETWEPGLAIDVWSALHECYAALQRGADASEKQHLNQAGQRVFQRVAAIDPARALALSARSTP